MSPLYFFLKNLATFFSLIAVTITIAFYCFNSGVTPLEGVIPHLFYLSDLVSPLFFVNLPTIFFSFGCHPPEGCHPGRSVPLHPSLVTPLAISSLLIPSPLHSGLKTHLFHRSFSSQIITHTRGLILRNLQLFCGFRQFIFMLIIK